MRLHLIRFTSCFTHISVESSSSVLAASLKLNFKAEFLSVLLFGFRLQVQQRRQENCCNLFVRTNATPRQLQNLAANQYFQLNKPRALFIVSCPVRTCPWDAYTTARFLLPAFSGLRALAVNELQSTPDTRHTRAIRPCQLLARPPCICFYSSLCSFSLDSSVYPFPL